MMAAMCCKSTHCQEYKEIFQSTILIFHTSKIQGSKVKYSYLYIKKLLVEEMQEMFYFLPAMVIKFKHQMKPCEIMCYNFILSVYSTLHSSLSLPKERNHNTDAEKTWYAQRVPSSGCCVNCRCYHHRCSHGYCSCLSHTCAHISYFVHSSQLYILWTAGGAVGSHCNILAPCSNSCAGVEGTIPFSDGDSFNAGPIDAIGEVSDEFPVGGSTERWREWTAGWCTDNLAPWAVNICHLETQKQQ